jgi:hypothetical protein
MNFLPSWAAPLYVVWAESRTYGYDRCSVLVITGVFKFVLLQSDLLIQHNMDCQITAASTMYNATMDTKYPYNVEDVALL